MSHEIRTPLNGILGMDEMIIRDTDDSRIRRYALDIKSAGNTLLSLINDILDLSKIQAGEFEIVQTEYGLASVINDIINITRSKALQKKLPLSLFTHWLIHFQIFSIISQTFSQKSCLFWELQLLVVPTFLFQQIIPSSLPSSSIGIN